MLLISKIMTMRVINTLENYFLNGDDLDETDDQEVKEKSDHDYIPPNEKAISGNKRND